MKDQKLGCNEKPLSWTHLRPKRIRFWRWRRSILARSQPLLHYVRCTLDGKESSTIVTHLTISDALLNPAKWHEVAIASS